MPSETSTTPMRSAHHPGRAYRRRFSVSPAIAPPPPGRGRSARSSLTVLSRRQVHPGTKGVFAGEAVRAVCSYAAAPLRCVAENVNTNDELRSWYVSPVVDGRHNSTIKWFTAPAVKVMLLSVEGEPVVTVLIAITPLVFPHVAPGS